MQLFLTFLINFISFKLDPVVMALASLGTLAKRPRRRCAQLLVVGCGIGYTLFLFYIIFRVFGRICRGIVYEGERKVVGVDLLNTAPNVVVPLKA